MEGGKVLARQQVKVEPDTTEAMETELKDLLGLFFITRWW